MTLLMQNIIEKQFNELTDDNKTKEKSFLNNSVDVRACNKPITKVSDYKFYCFYTVCFINTVVFNL